MSNAIIYNCHTHSFNAPCVPDAFLGCYIPSTLLRKLITPLIRWKPTERILQFLLGFAGQYSRYAGFIRVASYKEQDDVFLEAFKALPPDSRVVVLSMNFDYMGGGDPIINYSTQITALKEVIRKYPQNCLPFYSVDPRKGTAQQNLDDLFRFFDKEKPFGFVGIKLYPALGFYPFDPRLEKVYAFAQENNIPITSHCTNGGAYLISNPIPPSIMNPISFHATTVVRNYHLNHPFDPKKSNAYNKDKFSHPINYYDVLEAFPNLKLNIAHYGGDDMILNYLKNNTVNGIENWYVCIRDMILKKPITIKEGDIFTPSIYKNLYTDISYSLHNNTKVGTSSVVNQIASDISTTLLGDRILYGTDYFMTVQFEEEKALTISFKNELLPDDYQKITNANPRRFLTSNFYIAN